MKKAVRAIVINGDKILVMKRNKFGSEYYTLIGGHVEMGESTEHALMRELHEETQLSIKNARLVYVEAAPAPYGDQYVYLCEYVDGEPELRSDSDEKKINAIGNNLYTPMWLPISKLEDVPFRSEKLKNKILSHLQNGFPSEVIEFSSNNS